ncbi:hypothetical protein [Methanoregula sp.]|uniref:hypothetical protein n=1 Tax=Methanoregula sp. TaxID=2052170 RepID=UPI003C735466
MEKRTFILLCSGILLAAILGLLLMAAPDQSGSAAQPLPRFQPGIWDQPVIRPPYNSSAGLFDYPFMYQYELNASTGFASAYKKYYRPTYILAPGTNATIVMNVTSYSRQPIRISVVAIDNLPAYGFGYVQPGPLVLRPGESRLLSVQVYALPDASLPDDPSLVEEGDRQLACGPWLEAEGWQIGQGFYLKPTP